MRAGVAVTVTVAVAVALAIAACDSGEHDDEPVPEPPVCAPGTWGAPELDALYPALFERDASVLLGSPSASAIGERLELAARRIPADLSPRARIALQNDVWGLVDRIEASGEPSADATAIVAAGRSLARALAPSDEELRALAGDALPAIVRRALPPADGWRERGSEMPVLSHERLFRLRRIFRVLERPGGRALVSQLVALDREGQPHLTDVVGEIEVLAIDAGGTQRGDRVLHLDRRGLRCEGAHESLEEVAELAHLPGDGADGFLVELSPPVAIRDNPCARCHEPGEGPMSLPSDAVEPAERIRRLLAQRRDLRAPEPASLADPEAARPAASPELERRLARLGRWREGLRLERLEWFEQHAPRGAFTHIEAYRLIDDHHAPARGERSRNWEPVLFVGSRALVGPSERMLDALLAELRYFDRPDAIGAPVLVQLHAFALDFHRGIELRVDEARFENGTVIFSGRATSGGEPDLREQPFETRASRGRPARFVLGEPR